MCDQRVANLRARGKSYAGKVKKNQSHALEQARLLHGEAFACELMSAVSKEVV